MGISRRVQKLEKQVHGRKRPPHSTTEIEARALVEEIAELDRQIAASGDDTDPEPDEFMESIEGLPLEDQITALEEEIGTCQDD